MERGDTPQIPSRNDLFGLTSEVMNLFFLLSLSCLLYISNLLITNIRKLKMLNFFEQS